jgi:hypothetical protein
MRTLMAGILILAALALGGALLLCAPEDTAAHPRPASRAAAPRVAEDEGTVRTAAIPFARYETSSSSVLTADTQEPEVGPQASVEPPALSGIIVGPDGERVTDPMTAIFYSPNHWGPSAQRAPVREGKFEFKTLVATEGSISVASTKWLQNEFVVARKGDQDLVIPVQLGGSISGRVSLSDSGFDKVVVRMRHGSTRSESLCLVRATGGSSFGFRPVPPGFVDIEVLLPPFNEVLADVPSVAVPSGRRADDSRLDPIYLPIARRANLRVVDRAGLPVREFTVLAEGGFVEQRSWIQGAADVEAFRESFRGRFHLPADAVVTLDPDLPNTRCVVALLRGDAGQGFASLMHQPPTPEKPVSILLGSRPQTLGILAPGHLPKVLELNGDAVVELTSAPSLQVTLAPDLPGAVGPAKGMTILSLCLTPEELEGLDDADVALKRAVELDILSRVVLQGDFVLDSFAHVELQGAVGLDDASRTFTVPTLGPGRYRLHASIARCGLGVVSHRSLPMQSSVTIGPGGASLPLTFDTTTWAAAIR